MKTQLQMTTKTLKPFLFITFVLAWGVAAAHYIFHDQIAAIFGEISLTNPSAVLAVYGPGFGSMFLILRHYEMKGSGKFVQRLTMRHTSRLWWLLVILAIPAIMVFGAALNGDNVFSFTFSPWHLVIPALVLALFSGLIEEPGSRGLALYGPPIFRRNGWQTGAALMGFAFAGQPVVLQEGAIKTGRADVLPTTP